MAKFNTKSVKSKVPQEAKIKNLAGGEAYVQSNEMALVSLLLTSFVNDQFYRQSKSSLDDLKELMSKIKDKEFIAKAAIYARDKFNMRSITHAIAAELASYSGKSEWGKRFYEKVVVRVDDMTEILSYYLAYKTSKDNPKFPNALKKGFAMAFNKFDGYQLSKYKGSDKNIKLVDIVNIVHPVPNKKNELALQQLICGTLKNTETWEAMLSKAGQIADSEEDLSKLKADAWSELISSRKIGIMALLRNLRNIISQAPDSVTMACEMLIDEKLIKKSRLFPFRFLTAYEEISKLGSSKQIRDVLIAINTALDISVNNVPKLCGETLVVIDVSGSMSGKPSSIASLFGSILAKANNCDVMTFANNANYKNYNPLDSVLTIRNSFNFSGGGTNLRSVFTTANKKYDNIIILSDMQSFIGYRSPLEDLNNYKKLYNANPHIYSWDLAGYGNLQFPEDKIYCMSGFSDKAFDIMNLLKMDKNALIREIRSITI